MQLSYEVTDVGNRSFVGSNEPVMIIIIIIIIIIVIMIGGEAEGSIERGTSSYGKHWTPME